MKITVCRSKKLDSLVRWSWSWCWMWIWVLALWWATTAVQRDTDDIFGITLTGQVETKSDNYCRIFNSPCCTKVLAIVSRKLKEIVRSRSRESEKIAAVAADRRCGVLRQCNFNNFIWCCARLPWFDWQAVYGGIQRWQIKAFFATIHSAGRASAKITDHLPVRRLDVGRCCHCCSRCLAALWRQLRRDDNHTHTQTLEAQSSTSAQATAASTLTVPTGSPSLFSSLSPSLSANYSPALLTCLLPFASFSYWFV